MLFMKRGKKGELTSSQIITIVLAIAGFIVVLIFLAILFEDRGEGDRELCKFSVLTRATSPIGSLQASIPLKCTTEKICISASGKKDACKQFAGEEDKSPVKLKGSVDEKARKIEETYANAMFDCWNMMGEGKLDVFPGSDRPKSEIGTILSVIGDALGIPKKLKPACVICSRVALADDLFDENGEPKEFLKKVDTNRYLKDEFIPNTNEKYIKYFSDEQVRGFLDKEFFEQGLVVDSRDKKGNEIVEFEDKEGKKLESVSLKRPEPTNQMAFVFMQIITEESALKAASDAGAATGFVFAGAAVASPFRVLNAVGFWPRVGVVLATIGLTAGFSYLTQDANQVLAAGYCGEFTKEGKKSQGCSLLKPVDYNDISQINDLCFILEGNP